MIHADQEPEKKRAAYAADITYGTNNEFGFDYLRDNLAFSLDERVQRELNFAIVDEVDSILIDEARTPLIISGPAEESTETLPGGEQAGALAEAGGRGPTAPATSPSTRRSKQAYLTEAGHEQRRGAARRRRDSSSEGREPVRRAQHHADAASDRRAARARSSTAATWNTSSRTARSSSSTSSPAAPCRAGAGPTACTRPSRRRKACRCARKTRPWPPSPSRTISACTRSCPA